MNPSHPLSRPEAQLARVLNVLAGALVLLAVVTLVSAYVNTPGSAPLFNAPPFWVSNSLVGLLLVAFLAWLAAADVRRFRPLILIVIASLVVGAVALILTPINLAPSSQPVNPVYLPLILILIAIFTGICLYNAALTAPEWQPWIPAVPPTSAERTLRIVLGVFGVASLSAALLSIALPFLDPASSLVISPVFLSGSTMKFAGLGLLALPIAYDPRRFTQHIPMITALLVGNAASLIVIVALVWLGLAPFSPVPLTVAGITLAPKVSMFGALLLDGVVIAGLLLLNRTINRALLAQLKFLSPSEFRALEATVETLIAGETAERLAPHEVVLRTDGYLGSFQSSRLNLAKLAAIGLGSFPLIWLKPPINYMRPAERQAFINGRFKEDVINPSPLYRGLDALVRAVNTVILFVQGRRAEELGAALSFTGLIEAMLRFNMQLTYLGYYSHPAAWPRGEDGSGIGYVPFSERPKDFDVKPRRPHPPLDVKTPAVLERDNVETITDADVVIIGSGAAGAILAEQLLERGRRVLMIEKGRYVHPDDFSEDEVDMISRLYGDGALQISQALRFTILQGSCVGGTTVVNNAVCFDTPDRVLEKWNSHGEVIDVARFKESQRLVRERMRIRPITAGTRQPLDGGVLNHGDGVVTRGINSYFKNGGYRYDVVQANIVDCLGCGYCNIGCKYGRKLSMLDEVLPSAQAKYGADNFRILSESEATKLVEEQGTVTEVHVTVGGGRKLVIKQPKTVIVSAGTIASSWLLMQSGIGKAQKLPVGQGLSFNMGSPLHARFDQPLHAYDGLQIAHYLAIDEHPGFVYETWYNPPVAQALAMPGWLDTHFQNMQHYDRMAAVGVLIGTESNARIVPALVSGGPDIVFQPTAGDLKKLLDALVILGDIFFAGGAQEVYASTRTYQTYKNGAAVFSAQSEIDKLRQLVQRDEDILLGTGHPQGGNPIGVSPNTSVIGEDFRVHGYNNLYVCDASVFPTSTTVNPQLTVMTMAHYAADLIAH